MGNYRHVAHPLSSQSIVSGRALTPTSDPVAISLSGGPIVDRKAGEVKRILRASFLLELEGCTTSKSVYLPDGRLGYSINCSGTALDWGSSLQKAGEKCGAARYELLMRDERTGQTTIVTVNPYLAQGTGAPTVTREMVIACEG